MLLAPKFGLIGIVSGTAVGWLAGAVFFTIAFHRLRPAPWWRPVGRPALVLAAGCAVASSGLWYAVHSPTLQPLVAGRIGGGIALIVLGLAYAALYAGLSVAAGVWRADPAGLLARLLRRGRLLATTGLAR
jgi:peptidoglycan biosynthesis protein MviN/MurJ (putative lipid II flippase)